MPPRDAAAGPPGRVRRRRPRHLVLSPAFVFVIALHVGVAYALTWPPGLNVGVLLLAVPAAALVGLIAAGGFPAMTDETARPSVKTDLRDDIEVSGGQR